MPDLGPGPLRDLMVELHALHRKAGFPSTRQLADGTPTATTEFMACSRRRMTAQLAAALYRCRQVGRASSAVSTPTKPWASSTRSGACGGSGRFKGTPAYFVVESDPLCRHGSLCRTCGRGDGLVALRNSRHPEVVLQFTEARDSRLSRRCSRRRLRLTRRRLRLGGTADRRGRQRRSSRPLR